MISARLELCKGCGEMGERIKDEFVPGKGYTRERFVCPRCDGEGRLKKSWKRPEVKRESKRTVEGEGTIVTLNPWIAGKKGLPIILHGDIVRTTARAILLRRVEGPEVWLPRSQITISSGPIQVPVDDSPRSWIIDEIEGHTNRLVKTHRFHTEGMAIEAWNNFRGASRFAGVGGKYRHTYSYPRKEEVKRRR